MSNNKYINKNEESGNKQCPICELKIQEPAYIHITSETHQSKLKEYGVPAGWNFCPVCECKIKYLDQRHVTTEKHKTNLKRKNIAPGKDPARKLINMLLNSSTWGIKYAEKEPNYEEIFEENIECYGSSFDYASIKIHTLLRNIEKNLVLVPPIQRSIVWNREDVRELIISLYEGTTIGSMSFWKVPSAKEYTKPPFRKIVESKKVPTEDILLTCDGIQRQTALALVFSDRKVKIHDHLQNLDLYYNFLLDTFAFSDEISELDGTWMNLKEVYGPRHIPKKLSDNFLKKISNIIDKIKDTSIILQITNRVGSIFGMMGVEIQTEIYTGDDLEFAHNLMKKRNRATYISPLDFFFSLVSIRNPSSRNNIKKFSKFTRETLSKKFELNFYDVILIALHLADPESYSLSEIKWTKFDFNSYNSLLSEIINNSSFLKFISSLEDAIMNLLPRKDIKTKYRDIITKFKTKTALYACYCVYLFCKNQQKEKEFHEFLAKYFVYNIITDRFNKRELDMHRDLRTLLDGSKDFRHLRQRIYQELDSQFWEEILPQKFLVCKVNYSDLALLYHLTLFDTLIFNSKRIRVGNFLFNKQLGSIAWIKVFHKSWFSKDTISPASVLNKILINYMGRSRRRLTQYRPWSWLEEILANGGINSSNLDKTFKAWDFPTGYEEEMKKFSKVNTRVEGVEYMRYFFEKRARKMASAIKNTFFREINLK